MLMVWDEPKRESNRAKHGLDFADARDRFEWESAAINPAHPSRTGTPRYMAVGFLDGRMVALTFSLLGAEAISAISLRAASNRERKAYAVQSEA